MKGKLLLIGSLLLACSANAASLRCPKGIASTGDRGVEVLSKCGEPVSKSVIGYVTSPRQNIEVPQEEWIYTPEGGMQYFLLIEGGVLTRIDSKRGS
ncbi:DUF2845 domain-containing protein [Pseudomonas sp. Gutcm_11s]|uniref:DUF2845 domain-containing protein n=1 Tax=Pseudomonas sp. Gutcm_11s TaxID=3026088 RepID=UPI00235FF470|nr:DUF2845 domain-containing protein [Pseudomonas sp. Gutcm_11s]MDD0844665.1 DUF2845 domain-containing protein [Pseudomonas sp. Gutcm_11s]